MSNMARLVRTLLFLPIIMVLIPALIVFREMRQYRSEQALEAKLKRVARCHVEWGPKWQNPWIFQDFIPDEIDRSLAYGIVAVSTDAKLPAEVLVELRICHSIEKLDLNVAGLDGRQLKCLHTFRRLKELSLRGAKNTDECLRQLKDLPLLYQLILDDSDVMDAGLEAISGLVNLKTLSLKHTAESEAGLRHVMKLPRIAHLRLAGTMVRESGWVPVAGKESLITLGLERSQITDDGLRDIGRLKNLGALDLNDTEITSDGLEYLRDLKRLVSLSLIATRVDSVDVFDDGFQSLKHVRLDGTGVTWKARNQLTQRLRRREDTPK